MERKQDRKAFERSIVHQAALKLGEEWEVNDRESPDFLVDATTGRFGLEVTECHAGPKDKGGSPVRRSESFNSRWLAEVRREFSATSDTPLHVRYYGEASDAARLELLDVLQSARFEERSDFFSLWQAVGEGRVFAFKTQHSAWNVFSDRSGPMSSDGHCLQREIDKKAEKLARYHNICTDVRLLAFTFPTYNSGRFELPEGFIPDLRGFDVVYFFSYPARVRVFDRRK